MIGGRALLQSLEEHLKRVVVSMHYNKSEGLKLRGTGASKSSSTTGTPGINSPEKELELYHMRNYLDFGYKRYVEYLEMRGLSEKEYPYDVRGAKKRFGEWWVKEVSSQVGSKEAAARFDVD